MAENPTFDFGQGASEQAIDNRLSPLESASSPQIAGGPGDDFMKNFSALNANTKVDVYGTGRPMSISQRLNAPVGPSSTMYAPESLTDQYMYQEGFDTRYFNPFDSSNYQKFADKETWGSALGKGFDSFGYKFGNTFTDYWKGYGRMAEALFTLDWDKMKPDETTMMNQYYQDQIDMKKNFVFEQPGNEDSIFSKRTMSEFVGNAGFALGTFAGLGLEIAADVAITFFTGGAGAETFALTAANQAARTAARAASKTSVLGKVANFGGDVAQGFAKFGTKSVDELRVLNKMDEAASIANATPSALRSAISENLNIFTNNLLNIGKSKNFAQAAENILKGTPLLGTGIRYGERVVAAAKGGATAGQLTGLTLQGVRRVAQELNMSATEASFEAVTSYGDTLDKMAQQYKLDNDGKVPSPEEFEQMRSLAMNASAANYNTNMAILLATNKLQFGTLFNKFLPASMIVGETAQNILKVEAKGLTQLYKKGFTGAYGLTGQVARDFGKKEAAYQFGKAFFKDALKFEIVEGLQENLQETTASGWRDYYSGQMNGTQYTMSQAFGKGAEEQFTKQGLKTFLMGALTGSIIRLPTAVATRSLDKANAYAIGRQYKGDEANNPVTKAEKQLDSDISTLNTLFKQARTGNFEQKVFNFNAQMNASQEQTEAAATGNKYEFENAKDNALLSAVATAKRTHSIDALYSVIKNMGNEMTAEDFKKSFGVDLDSTKYSSAKEFSEEVAADIKKYSETIDKVREFAKNKLLDPNRYAKGSGSQYIAAVTRQAQEDAIQLIALNSIKGEMSAKRAKQVASDILAMPQMGPSADYALRILTNYENSFGEIGIIQSELKILKTNLAAEGLDPDVKEQLQAQIKDKEEELSLVASWTNFWNTRKDIAGKTQDEDNFTNDETPVFTGKKVVTKVIEKDDQGNDAEVEQDLFSLDHPEVIDIFKKLINLKNKQAGNKTEVSEQVLREGFEKIYDYMRLDTDTRDYMRSVDTLMNLENFQAALTRMTNGKFKFHIINYTEDLINQTAKIAVDHAIANNLSPDQSIEFTKKILTAVTESESYKNLLALAIDPTLGVDNQEYAIKLQTEIQNLTRDSLKEAIAVYKSDGLQDLTTAELDEIFAEGSLEFLSIRTITIVDKLVKGQPLLANEKKLYEKFKEELDAQVVEQKKRKPNPTEEVVTPEVPVVGPDGEIVPVVGPPEEVIPEVAPDNVVINVDENGNETVEEVIPVTEETPDDASQEGPVFTGGETDADQLNNMLGITPEREDAFEVDATEEGVINVVDRNDNVVNPEPFASEAAAQEQADSLNTTRANTEFVQKFIGPMIDPSDTAKIISMQTRGEKSMDRYNTRNNTTFATLEEYYNTPKGRELLEGIRESVITGNPVKYKKSKSVVTTLQVENQPTLFSTTTSPATSASLTLESLQTLHAEIQKALAPQVVVKQEPSNFAKDMFPLSPPEENGKAFGKLDGAYIRDTLIEKNGVVYATYKNIVTEKIDVYFAAQSETEYLGYMRMYEDGKPTEKFTSKLESAGNNKAVIKEMILNLQSMLPAYHLYTEDISVSTDGLRWWISQLKNGYELLRNENGEIVTSKVSINGAALVNELGITINENTKQFDNLPITNQKDFDKAKSVIEKYLIEMGVAEPNINWASAGASMTARFSLPVLVKRPGTISAPEMQQVSEKSSKFVEGPILTEESILDQLRDITECFS